MNDVLTLQSLTTKHGLFRAYSMSESAQEIYGRLIESSSQELELALVAIDEKIGAFQADPKLSAAGKSFEADKAKMAGIEKVQSIIASRSRFWGQKEQEIASIVIPQRISLSKPDVISEMRAAEVRRSLLQMEPADRGLLVQALAPLGEAARDVLAAIDNDPLFQARQSGPLPAIIPGNVMETVRQSFWEALHPDELIAKQSYAEAHAVFRSNGEKALGALGYRPDQAARQSA